MLEMIYIIGMRSRCDDSYIGYYEMTRCYWTTDRTRAYPFQTERGAHMMARFLRQRYPAYAGFIDTIVTEQLQ